MNKQAGFTLIELISVIVILGILSAFAIPRFANLEVQARAASVQGLEGAIRSASALVHAVWLAQGGSAGPPTVSMEGANVTTNSDGYPDGLVNISAALQEPPDGNGYTLQGTGFAATGANDPATCIAEYDSSVTPPNISSTTTGC